MVVERENLSLRRAESSNRQEGGHTHVSTEVMMLYYALRCDS